MNASRAEPPATGADGKPKLAYIDCLRGYAVLLVIACHTAYAYNQLPYPVHKLATFGWHGVQLFFVASCMTLMMSAHSEQQRTGGLNMRNFFIRRFLRIAPMYYLAAAFYFVVMPPNEAGFLQLLASAAFVNAWHPVTTSTTGAWQVVPGGWSIGVEFTFYMAFAAFVAAASNVRRAGALLLGALGVAAVANSMLMPVLTNSYGRAAADNFLYFWPVNQAPVFIVGAITYFAVRSLDQSPNALMTRRVRRWSGGLIAAALLLLLATAWTPGAFSHQILAAPRMPQYLMATVGFALLALGMSQAGRNILINPLIARVGEVSFSAYLLHFAAIHFTLKAFPALFRTDVDGWPAIIAFGVGVMVVSGVTYAASLATYRLIEQPFMRYAKQLTRRPAAEAVAAP